MLKAYNLDLNTNNNNTLDLNQIFGLNHHSKLINNPWVEKSLELFIKPYFDRFLQPSYIDCDALKEEWFPDVNAHIFISHSHKDKNNAIALANYLYNEFGIISFIDSEVWNNIDSAIKMISDEYNKSSNNIYPYDKTIQIVKNLTLILSNALNQLIDNTEALIFLNTNNSIADSKTEYNKIPINDGEKLTPSPWIYNEILFSQTVRRKQHKDRTDQQKISEKQLIVESNESYKIEFVHTMDMSHMKLVDIDKLKKIKGINKGSNGIKQNIREFAALDQIYKIFDE